MLKDVKIVTDAGRFFTKQGWPGSQSAKLKKNYVSNFDHFFDHNWPTGRKIITHLRSYF
jgi:hypothetical protein